jgi:hypothetical protein
VPAERKRKNRALNSIHHQLLQMGCQRKGQVTEQEPSASVSRTIESEVKR